MSLWTSSMLPALLLAAWIPAQAQGQPARQAEPIAGKAAATKAAPARAAPAGAERKRLQVTATGAAPTAAAAARSTSPSASPSGAVLLKEKSHCHSSGSDA